MNIVIIGASGHWPAVNNFANNSPYVRITAYAPGVPEEATTPLETITHAKRYDDYRTMLDAEKPDIAVVNTFFYKNAEIAEECLTRNIHVYCEKPVALTIKALDHLQTVAQKSSAQFSAMHEFRYDPNFYKAHEVIREGIIGEPLLIFAQKSYRLGTRPAFYTHRETYGGTIPWVGIHAVDWVHWYSGGSAKLVSAAHTNYSNHNHGDLETATSALFTIAHGGSAVVTADYLRPAGASTHGDDRVRIAGTKGVVEVRGGKVFLIDGESERELLPADPVNIFGDFVRHIEDGTPMRISTDEVFAVTRLALEARDAADSLSS